jgi:hypothetical protein
MTKLGARVKLALAIAQLLIALVFFAFPALMLIWAIFDAKLASVEPASQSWFLHRTLSQKFSEWADARRATNAADQLAVSDISGTEWPAYSAVFYLRATEYLDQAWLAANGSAESQVALSAVDKREPDADRPSVYARPAIDAAAALIADPSNASWVKRYWGDRYLSNENVFYRMLLIDGLTSHVRLTGNDTHVALLTDQAISLSNELDASEFGLLDDYPNQCYPTDIVAAWRAIQRANDSLGLNLTAQIKRGLRAFVGAAQSAELELPPSAIDRFDLRNQSYVRGSYTSAMLFHSAYLWPEQSADWYQRYSHHFFRSGFVFTGFRELPEFAGPENFLDVDAGPVLFGLGTAASAFGVASARAHGRFDHARPIALEMIAASWPLPNGTLMLARAASDLSDAPFTGEAAILLSLTQPVAPHFQSQTQSASNAIPGMVLLMLVFYLGVFVLLVRAAVRNVRRWRGHL